MDKEALTAKLLDLAEGREIPDHLGDDLFYTFDMESPTSGLLFRMLTENLRPDTGLP